MNPNDWPPPVQVLVGWVLISVVVALGCARWFKFMRDEYTDDPRRRR